MHNWLKKNHLELQAHRVENKHRDPIFLLQFLNALYMADICAKLETNLGRTSLSNVSGSSHWLSAVLGIYRY